MERTTGGIPDDVLPEQIVEDEDGNMRVIPAERLVDRAEARENPLEENELGVENAENDLPCADVLAYGDGTHPDDEATR